MFLDHDIYAGKEWSFRWLKILIFIKINSEAEY